jgi:iron transport multicopper oxidase
MGLDGTGRPLFTLAGKTAATYAGHGVPTVTSLNGQPGTGIVSTFIPLQIVQYLITQPQVWISDTNKGLVAFKAVPVGGVLQPITIAATGGLTKYQRPVFGNGHVYVTGSNVIFALGTPVTLPLSCAGPVNFGSVNVGQTSTVQITCKALAAVTINGCSTSLATFQCQNSSLPSTVASGASFTFPVTWNLTQAAINQAQSNGHFQVLPGSEAAALDLYTTAGASGYATDTPIQLSGTVVAAQGYLVINASEVDFGGIVPGGSVSQLSSSVILSNQGTSVLTFSGFAWQDMYANGSRSITCLFCQRTSPQSSVMASQPRISLPLVPSCHQANPLQLLYPFPPLRREVGLRCSHFGAMAGQRMS